MEPHQQSGAFECGWFLDTNFNANLGIGPNVAVHAIAMQPDGRVLVGGGFTNFNGTALNQHRPFEYRWDVDTNFTRRVTSDTVEGIILQPDNRIVVGGQFTRRQWRHPQPHHASDAERRGGSDD